MRKFTALVITFVTVCLMSVTTTSAETKKEISLDASEQTLLRLLSGPVRNAIEDYYGEPRQYWNDEIISVQKVPNSYYYEVVMQVETFNGPHNPPYGIETMTFYISYGEVILKRFEHQGES